jgi:capsid protein
MREARAIATQSPAELLRGDAAPTTPAWDVTAWTGALGNGHQGADSSRMRGFVYFPELDTRKEITSYSRTEILRRSRFLYANTGVARRMINGLSRMIAGTGLVYQAATSDTQWNKLAEAYVENVIRSRHAYDLGGRYNGYNSQRASLIFRFRDGDCAQVLSRDEQTGAPRFAFYEGHQIGTSSIYTSPASTEGWRDGVYLGRHNQPLGYRILGDGDYADLDSGSVLFQCDYERGGQPRGVSALSHAINHLLDATEIKSYIKAGVKLTNLNAYWIETAAGASAGGSTLGSAAGAAGPKVKVDTPSGPINLQKILGGGEIPALGAGQSIKFNTSASPHPNQMGLLEHLIREASWGLPWGGMAPELLWNITGLGGANTRFVMADAQGFIESGQQALVDDKCQPEVEFILAAGLQSGALRRCQDPEWWKARWILPPRITVDFGRDGKLYLDQISRGALTFSRFHGWNGADAYPEIDRWLDEMKYWKDGAVSRGLDPTLVLGSVYGRSGITSPNADPALPTGDQADTGGENANDTEAMLTEIKKNPAKARAFLDQLARHD